MSATAFDPNGEDVTVRTCNDLESHGAGARLNIKAAVRNGWGLFRERPLTFVAYGFLAVASRLLPVATAWATVAATEHVGAAVLAALGCAAAVHPLRHGIAAGGLALMRGKRPAGESGCPTERHVSAAYVSRVPFGFSTFLDVYRFFFPLLAADVLAWFGFVCGVALVLPWMVFVVIFTFTPLACLEYSNTLGITDAIWILTEVARMHFWQLCALYITTAGIIVLGLLCFGVGVFVAIPVAGLVWADAFRQLVGLNDAWEAPRICGR